MASTSCMACSSSLSYTQSPRNWRLPFVARLSVLHTELKPAAFVQASHTLLASLLVLNLQVAGPASSQPEHVDYISVQDRTRQRSPLSSKPQPKDLFISEPTSTLSIVQQVADVKRLSGEAISAASQDDYKQVDTLALFGSISSGPAIVAVTFAAIQALEKYTLITRTYPDLAITQYARIQRALLLYQLGQHSEAVLELEGEEEDLRGNSEVHAALAAMFYAQSPRQVSRAETQWEIVREFDQRFGDLQWVSKQRKWPPAMQVALANFLQLK